MNYEIQHDMNKNRFFVIIDGFEAYIQYSRIDDDKIDAFKTYVPEELRGRSIAADLTENLLAFAEKEDLTIVPSCSYIRKYMSQG